MKNRIDLTEWAVHFIHNPDFTDNPLPVCFDPNGKPVFSDYDEWDSHYYESKFVDTAFDVLEKIIFDGFIKSTWSFRNGKPTVYGSRSAVCFSEMPLYALIQYAEWRKNLDTVDKYAIALKKEELFRAGGRPAIYGLSQPDKAQEAIDGDEFFGKGLRCLSSQSGLSLLEQYRYVATVLSVDRSINWMHEREWRWPYDNIDPLCPGLPIWLRLDGQQQFFSEVILIVFTNEEAEKILDKLKVQFDSGYTANSGCLDESTIANTKILSLENLAGLNLEKPVIRLDDLPLKSLPKIKRVFPSKETCLRVKQAIVQAEIEAKLAISEIRQKANGTIQDVFGFAFIKTASTDSEITSALVKLGYADPSPSSDEYSVLIGRADLETDSILCIEEAAANAAANYLTNALEQDFYVETVWD